MTLFSQSLATQLTKRLLLPQAATASVELIINKALGLNHNKSVSFTAIADKTLTLELAELDFQLCFTVSTQASTTTNQAFVMVRTKSDASDCTIKTSLGTLKKVKNNQSLTQLIKDDELDVVGDIKVAQQFAAIAQSLEIDWRSEIAKHLGDVPTHKLLNLGHKFTQSVKAKGKQLEADIGEYIVHEKRLTVTTSQINNFNKKTKDIATQVEGVSARIDKLLAKLADKKA